MKGNFHVQFLGEGVAATSPPYPTPGWATTQVYPARGDPGIHGPTHHARPGLACCKVAVDARFLSYRIRCGGSGKVS